MISEQQIRDVLALCEEALGIPLSDLRGRLLRQQNYDGTIWELLVLHACLRRFRRVIPEPGVGMPDVIVKSYWRLAMSFEVTTVTSKISAEVDLASDFHYWIYRQLAKSNPSLNGAAISTEASAECERVPHVPKPHKWPQMARHQTWSRFANQVERSGSAIWNCPYGDISVSFEGKQDGLLTGNLFTPQMPTDITRHPVYRAIRAKARQASKWAKHIRERPIILVICAPRGGSEFDNSPEQNEFSVDRAVWSALLDHERLPDLDRVNILRQRLTFAPSGVRVASNRLRVAGSRLISAVLFVRIEQIHDRAQVTPASQAVPRLYVNSHAETQLTKRQLQRIKTLDFNFLQYGPGWEAWHGSPRESQLDRSMRRGGSIEYRFDKEGKTEMRIPAVQLLKILSGEKSAEAVFADYGGPPNPIDKFKQALSSELSLEAISIVNPDPGSRDEQSVAFVFGPGEKGVISRSKKTK